MTLPNLILIPTTLAAAMIAGLFYAYSCSVNPGLSKLPDADYIRAMQYINIAIVNPVVLASFLGTMLLLPFNTYLVSQEGLSDRFWLLCGATLLYWTGSFGITIFGNIPLNDALSSFDLSSASTDLISQQRAKFEQPWNRFHRIRTLASVASLLLVILADVIRR